MTTPGSIRQSLDVELVMHDLIARTIEVVRTERVSAGMQRVVLGGAELAGFVFLDMAPDDHVKLFFPNPKTGELVLPSLGPNGIRPKQGGALPIHRDYTVRAFNRDRLEVSFDFALHTHGVGGAWAEHAQPGERLGVVGPRGSHVYPTGYDWYLLAADETALPALSRWLEELPEDRKVAAFIEVSGPDDEVTLPRRRDTHVQYLHRGSAEPGSTTLLFDAIRAHRFPAGDFFAWIAGEANSLKPIRRYLRRELNVAKDRVKVDGYWRRGTVNHDHHEVDDDD